MLNRRELLQRTAMLGAAGAIGSSAACRGRRGSTGAATTPNELDAPPEKAAPEGVVLNDRQSQLNATRVRKVVDVHSLKDVQAEVVTANQKNQMISVAGGRHAMGGQQFGEDTVHLDTVQMKRVLAFDSEKGTIRAQAGINWLELIDYLHAEQEESEQAWSIRQKQTGVDRVSLAGTLSANAHGRGLKFPPIVSDVESIVLVKADGRAVSCSREENAELFSLAVGGYGLFGVIVEVTLRLVPRVKVQRKVEIIDVAQLIEKVEGRIADGYEFGDCQYSTDFSDLSQTHRGVFSCYKPIDEAAEIPNKPTKLSPADWTNLILLGHVDKKKAFETYSQHYLKTDGQVYWSDTHQLSNNFNGYHKQVDADLKSSHKGSEMITELYVAPDRLNDFLAEARKAVHDEKIDLIYGTIRFIERDDVSFLAWAKEPSVCVLCNLHVDHTPAGIAKVAEHARKLIQIAIDHGGRYFPTYHRWATKEQVTAAYPQFTDFLKLKRKYDPNERFQSEWYRHYRTMFG